MDSRKLIVMVVALSLASDLFAAPPGQLPTLAPLLKEITPAVVNIAVDLQSPEKDNPLLRDPLFGRHFRSPERPQLQEKAAGSGVIVDAAQGYVLTNHHVVHGATKAVVILKDRRQLVAKIIGSDPGTDIALLKIEPERLKALSFGDSDALNVGDYVLAIGNPFGLGQTVTSGIVSALGRTGLNLEGYEDFIQTDAPINPGNSGGALIDMKGQLIGINTAIYGPSNVGIGFAVPSNMARAVMEQLIRYGEVQRGRFGASVEDLSPEMVAKMGLSNDSYALVVEIAPGSSADRAGLQPGDIVTHINKRMVRNSADLRNQVGLTPIGEQVELTVLRQGKEHLVSARVEGARPPGSRVADAIPELNGTVMDSAEGTAQSQGAKVIRVEPGSASWTHGLRDGDVIAAVNRRNIRSTRELMTALRGATRPITLNVVRGENALTITLP